MKIAGKNLKADYRNHVLRWRVCIKCDMARFRDKIVLGRGRLPCDVLFIGEAPGLSEDTIGEPFVGRAGQLLEKWIDAALISCGRFDAAITNVVACRPTEYVGGDNRKPTPLECSNCKPRLLEMLYMAQPKLIVALGKTAENYLLKSGILREAMALSAKVVALRHPAYVLRHGGDGSDTNVVERERLRRYISDLCLNLRRR